MVEKAPLKKEEPTKPVAEKKEEISWGVPDKKEPEVISSVWGAAEPTKKDAKPVEKKQLEPKPKVEKSTPLNPEPVA